MPSLAHWPASPGVAHYSIDNRDRVETSDRFRCVAFIEFGRSYSDFSLDLWMHRTGIRDSLPFTHSRLDSFTGRLTMYVQYYINFRCIESLSHPIARVSCVVTPCIFSPF